MINAYETNYNGRKLCVSYYKTEELSKNILS